MLNCNGVYSAIVVSRKHFEGGVIYVVRGAFGVGQKQLHCFFFFIYSFVNNGRCLCHLLNLVVKI